MNRVLPAFLLSLGLAFLSLFPGTARADLYAYVDEEGEMHFAHEKLDERYELFAKGQQVREELNMSTQLKYVPELNNRLEDHILYKRIQRTPNVKKYEALVASEARRQQLDPALVMAVIAVESAYDPLAVSSKGAIGLMQLIPDTAQRYGITKISDPKSNIGGGTRYLKDLITMFGGNLSLALAGYNAGEGAVRQYKNAIPPYPETQQYVKLVMQFYAYFGGRGTSSVERMRGGRVRVTLPGRRNMPAPAGESVVEKLARDPVGRTLVKPQAGAPQVSAAAAASELPVQGAAP